MVCDSACPTEFMSWFHQMPNMLNNMLKKVVTLSFKNKKANKQKKNPLNLQLDMTMLADMTVTGKLNKSPIWVRKK